MKSLPRNPVYLDYNATTPVDPRVLEAMLPYLKQEFGNPSSSHIYGTEAKEAVEKARRRTADLISAHPDEVVFTSGGSESDNQAITGIAFANLKRTGGRGHIITSSVEHPAVAETCKYLEAKFGFRVTYLPVDRSCSVNPDDVKKAMTDKTILISVMHANNEVGTIEPLREIGEIARESGVPLHTDASQSCGKVNVDVDDLRVDLLTMAGHKMYAPKGVGALYIRRGVVLDSFLHGAGQEKGRRAGTENVPHVVGLGVACELAREALPSFGERVKALRDRLYEGVCKGIGEERVSLHGHPTRRLPNTLNIGLDGIRGEEFLARIQGIAASTGSACHSGTFEPSEVLLKMGLSAKQALGALRLSLGRWTTAEEVDLASSLVVKQYLKDVAATRAA